MTSNFARLRLSTAALAAVMACGGSTDGDAEAGNGTGDSGILTFTTTGTDSRGTDDADSGVRLDVGEGNATDGGDCSSGGGMTQNAFSIIWIANSPDGTVSKIDTVTATELARYRTGPDSPDPSRTSVNLEGDVAVGNRHGSVTKIAARIENCIDKNGDGQIITSSGPLDVLPWGIDECVLWHHDTGFDAEVSGNTGGPRAIAWDPGDPLAEPCQQNDPDLWVGWRNQPDTSVTVRKLDGATGAELGEALVPDWQQNWGHGTYGGAADADGNFWGLGTAGSVIMVAADDYSVSRWDNPTSHVLYGIALDAVGNPWLAGYGGNLWLFDRETQMWVDKGDSAGGPSRMRGLAIDGNGHAWIAGNSPCALIRYDTTTDTLVDGNIPLPGCATPVGVSIDVDGMVWVVDRDSNEAYKVDPTDYTIVTVPDLVSPYTYSDMTGAGLDLVVNPPAG